MPRPIWGGSISFGLVNVPVRMFAAVAPKDVRFHQLHAKDNVRIQQRRVCALDGAEVPYEEVVKGYEIEPDRYVTVTQEELEQIAPKATRSIEIEEFVELDEIDPMLYEHSYYLVPGDGAAKAYTLLLRAMEDSGKVALGRVVIRTKQYLAAIRPVENVLALATMSFADEVVPQSDIPGVDGAAEPATRELEMAKTLVESLSGPFEPERYKDDYRLRLLDLIEKKSKGRKIVAAPAEEQPAEVVDLMAALEASLAAAKSRAGADEEEAEEQPRGRSRARAAKKG
jgi:DNA end-binding protein Ku